SIAKSHPRNHIQRRDRYNRNPKQKRRLTNSVTNFCG
ncbi:MAG: hypothetical protein ACI861_001968, partial [Paracoccaceae bacterium]